MRARGEHPHQQESDDSAAQYGFRNEDDQIALERVEIEHWEHFSGPPSFSARQRTHRYSATSTTAKSSSGKYPIAPKRPTAAWQSSPRGGPCRGNPCRRG